jgi:chemotaxis protein methyltransferase CheR
VSATTVEDDYVEFCGALRQLTGIDLAQYKRQQMERRVRTFFERRGITHLSDAVAHLNGDGAHLDALLDRITINVSQLWRDPEQWAILERQVIPELTTTGALRAWSAGCSYGAEAYTLATVCHTSVPGARISIRGTDIDRRMIARARQGHFSADDARSAPRAHLLAGFEQTEHGWRAKTALKQMTRFETGDLLRTYPRLCSFDLILCRNTVIYFDEQIRDELHARLVEGLRPGGVLVIGSTERVSRPAALGLDTVHPFIYRKA